MHQNILDKNNSVLLVIDVQDKFKNVIHNTNELVDNVLKLIKGFNLLNIPILYTEQYPKGLGKTVDSLLNHLDGQACFEKICFSCCGLDQFNEHLKRLNRKQIVVCGVEAHVCVNQTVHDLIENGFTPHVVCDAISSRTKINYEIAVKKMQQSGAILSTVEMALFELMKTSKNEHFREVQKVII